MSYISLELAKAQFTGNFQNYYAPGEIKALLDEVPAADVVEVIRCENCKHHEKLSVYKYPDIPARRQAIFCKLSPNTRSYLKEVSADDFCSDGERED